MKEQLLLDIDVYENHKGMSFCFLIGCFICLFVRKSFAQVFKLCSRSHCSAFGSRTRMPEGDHFVQHVFISLLEENFSSFKQVTPAKNNIIIP
ncbi:hypothetical protein RM11_1058 [Bartonella quintana RM-11]|nr:hypothetical protein RM11_1058 [Bartonella quintana RM-11]